MVALVIPVARIREALAEEWGYDDLPGWLERLLPSSGCVLSAEEVAQVRAAITSSRGLGSSAALALLDGKPDAAGSSKGRTPAFEAEDQGSSPCPAVKWEATVRFDASAEMASMVLGAVHDAALRLSETAVGSLALLDGADEEKP